MYDLEKRVIFTEGTAEEVIKALSSLPGDCKVFLGGGNLVALHVSTDEKTCSLDEVEELEDEYEDINAFLVDVGVLLESDHKEFQSYSRAYDGERGYYDENQYYVKEKKQAIKEAKEYVEKGVERTYAIVSETKLPAFFDFNEGCVEDEGYKPENVVYCVAKINGKIVEHFINQSPTVQYVGTLRLDTTVDITDPCYDKGTWCRMTTECVPGLYLGHAEIRDEEEWGKRVSSLSISLDGKVRDKSEMKRIGNIGVDAGLAGFFKDKPDFNDEEWDKLCDEISEGDFWNLYNGIFSSSGYGDGSYEVYSNEEKTAFMIVFI